MEASFLDIRPFPGFRSFNTLFELRNSIIALWIELYRQRLDAQEDCRGRTHNPLHSQIERIVVTVFLTQLWLPG
jgi:hypothetical protein